MSLEQSSEIATGGWVRRTLSSKFRAARCCFVGFPVCPYTLESDYTSVSGRLCLLKTLPPNRFSACFVRRRSRCFDPVATAPEIQPLSPQICLSHFPMPVYDGHVAAKDYVQMQLDGTMDIECPTWVKTSFCSVSWCPKFVRGRSPYESPISIFVCQPVNQGLKPEVNPLIRVLILRFSPPAAYLAGSSSLP